MGQEKRAKQSSGWQFKSTEDKLASFAHKANPTPKVEDENKELNIEKAR